MEENKTTCKTIDEYISQFSPTPSGSDVFKDELSEYKGAKGSVQFPIKKPLPYEFVSKIVAFRVAENIKNAEEKLKKKK